MATPKDILLSAYAVIKQYGDLAEEHATKMMWDFKHKKDAKAADAWQLILKGIIEIRNIIPPKDTH